MDCIGHAFFNSNVSEIWPTETASDSLKTGVTKKLSQEQTYCQAVKSTGKLI